MECHQCAKGQLDHCPSVIVTKKKGGGNDRVVTPEAQLVFCENVPHCKGVTIKGDYHELFIEKDGMREKALSAILDFINRLPK